MFISTQISGNPRVTPRFSKFMESVKVRTDILKERFMVSDMGTSPTITFVKSLLGYLSEPEYLKKDLFDLYYENLPNDIAMVSRKFDSTESGTNLVKDVFVFGDYTREYIIPTVGVVGTQATLIDGWDVWQHVQPIKLLAHNSSELNVLNYSSQLKFRSDKPEYVVIGIDTGALLLKYIVYLKEHNLELGDWNIDDFIIKYVLSYLFDDMVEVWVTNLLQSIITKDETDYAANMSSLLSKTELNNAIVEAVSLIDGYEHGALRLGDLLVTPFYGNKGLYQCINDYTSTYGCIQTNRYIGSELIKMSSLLTIYIALLRRTVKKKLYTTEVRKVIVDLEILSRKRWGQYVRNAEMKLDIERLLTQLDLIEIDFR